MKEQRLYIIHMLEVLEKIEQYTKNGKIEFLNSTLIQDAVYRNFEIIGEAASRCSLEMRNGYPNIPWKTIVGLRNIIIH